MRAGSVKLANPARRPARFTWFDNLFSTLIRAPYPKPALRKPTMTTAFYSHTDCRLHDMGEGHPECPQRLDAIEDHLLATGLAVA